MHIRKRILCIGDSNTWGYDPRSYFGSRYPSEVRWTGLLERSGMQVLNCGENGMTIPGEAHFPIMERLIRSRLLADVVTVMLGTNDILEGVETQKIAERMKFFLHCVTETAPDAGALLIAPPVLKKGTWVQSEKQIENSVKLAVLYRDLADETGVDFADAESWGVELAFDGVHFSPAGHRAFAEGLQRTIDSFLEKTRKSE